MNVKTLFLFIAILTAQSAAAFAADFKGQFDKALVPNTEVQERIIFKFTKDPSLRMDSPPGEGIHLSAARIMNPVEGSGVKAMLVEDGDSAPFLYIDLNDDNRASENEKFAFTKEKADNPFLWKMTVDFPARRGSFTDCPIVIRYLKSVKVSKMSDDDRLLTQSTKAFARGSVAANGKTILVQYEYDFSKRKVDPEDGWLGVDVDGDGEIDMDPLSPEAANSAGEKIIFRAGDQYVSTKKADLDKNQIILREHKASDYRRIELAIGKELPDFTFTDLSGNKHRLSEFRGKFVLLDFWGFWCPPCLEELPHLRDAYRRFRSRNFEIVGMNTDIYTPASIKKSLADLEMTWTQARRDSFEDLLNIELRIEAFPTTFLLSPEGKILSMSRTKRDEPDLRGSDLIDTLDGILPKG